MLFVFFFIFWLSFLASVWWLVCLVVSFVGAEGEHSFPTKVFVSNYGRKER